MKLELCSLQSLSCNQLSSLLLFFNLSDGDDASVEWGTAMTEAIGFSSQSFQLSELSNASEAQITASVSVCLSGLKPTAAPHEARLICTRMNC